MRRRATRNQAAAKMPAPAGLLLCLLIFATTNKTQANADGAPADRSVASGGPRQQWPTAASQRQDTTNDDDQDKDNLDYRRRDDQLLEQQLFKQDGIWWPRVSPAADADDDEWRRPAGGRIRRRSSSWRRDAPWPLPEPNEAPVVHGGHHHQRQQQQQHNQGECSTWSY
jgi:hypothetical protein